MQIGETGENIDGPADVTAANEIFAAWQAQYPRSTVPSVIISWNIFNVGPERI